MAIAVSGTSIYIAGNSSSPTAYFGGGILQNSGTAYPQTFEAFVAKAIDAGNSASFAWVQQSVGANSKFAWSMAKIGNRVYIAGHLVPEASFGSHSLNFPVGYSSGYVGYFASLADTQLPLALRVFPESRDLFIFPNPARTTSTIQLAPLAGIHSATLTLFDALGRTMRTETVGLPAAGLRHELSLVGMAPGIYIVRVQAGDAKAVRRLEVE